MTPQVRTGLTHTGTALGGAVAALSFASSHSVDLYAIMDQLNVVVADITKLVALITPLATGAYGIWRSSNKNTLVDAAAVVGPDGKKTIVVASPEVAAATPQTNIVSNTDVKVEPK